MASWPVEVIPDPDELYLRVLSHFVFKGEVQPACFVAHGPGMSVDWQKYSSPEKTREGSPRKPASSYGVVSLVAGHVREIDGLSVGHSPTQRNRAHSAVTGKIAEPDIDQTMYRDSLSAVAALRIHPSDPVA